MKKWILAVAAVLVCSFSTHAYAANSAPAVGTVSPSYGASLPNTQVIFSSTYTDPDGWQNIGSAYILVNTSLSGSRCLYAYYNQNTNRIYLINDAGTGWGTGYAPGTARILQNSYVSLDCSKTTVTGSGTTMTVKWAVTFKQPFVSTMTKLIYMYVRDDLGAGASWKQVGTRLVGPNTAPQAVSIAPSTGSCAPDQQVFFTTTYSDANGAKDIEQARLLMNTSISATKCLYASYLQSTNILYLADDGGVFRTVGAPGSSAKGSNSYVTLDCSKTTVTVSGNNIMVRWAVTFKQAFAGAQAKNSYLLAYDQSSYSSGWAQKGTWSVIAPVPIADFIASPLSGNAPLSAQFTDRSTGYINSYLWDFGDGQTSALQNPLHAFSYAGTGEKFYTVSLKVTGPGGTATELKTDLIQVVVPPPVVTNVAPQSGAAGDTMMITGYNFGQTQGASTVTFFNDKAAQIVSWSSTSISCVVPAGAQTGDIVVATASGASDPVPFTIVMPLEILTKTLPDGIAGEDYLENLNANGGLQPYTWSIEAGTLPDGLVLDAAVGKISGRPTTVNTYGFTAKVTDSGSKTATQALSLNILAAYPNVTNEQLLDETEAKAAMYFYNEALPSGFVKDGNHKDFASVSATGFGLASLCVMAERSGSNANWTVTPEQARARVNLILDNCISYQNAQSPTGNTYGVAGFLYHFIKQDGTRQGTCEVSTIDMALFLSGAVTAGEYFGAEVKDKVNQIYSKLNWGFFYNAQKQQFSHGWFPESGILPATWDRPGDESILMALMALSSAPNNADYLKTMYSWPRVKRSYGGYDVVNSYFGSLFTYFQAHSFFDFEKLGLDNPSAAGSAAVPVNWWTNSISAANANRQFCIDNAATYSSYGPDSWGLTPCENPNGDYLALLGASPVEVQGGPTHNGTISPHGAISCMPLLRTSAQETLDANPGFKALKNYFRSYYHHLWGPYGPKDSFNNNREFSSNYLGIDVGPEVLMIENYRSRLVWDKFMNSERIVAAVNKVFGDPALPDPTNIYVNIANSADPSQDGTEAHPFDSIQEAIDSVPGNCVINIAPGPYSEKITIKDKLLITLKGVIGNRGNPTDSSANTLIDAKVPSAVSIENSKHIIIDSIAVTNEMTNVFGSAGGGINITRSTNTVVRDCVIFGCYAMGGGGIFAYDSYEIIISKNDIINNKGWTRGGGIYAYYADVLIENNNICGNTVSEYGAGLFLTGKDIRLKNNIISMNRTTGGYYPGQGGGGFVLLSDGNNNSIENNVIVYNQAGGEGGGGIYSSGPLIISDNIIAFNTNSGVKWVGAPGSLTLTYNNAYLNGWPSDYSGCEPGVGSISNDPMFTSFTYDNNPYNDDYHLQAGSPCINAGDPAPAFNDNDGSRNDMGVYGGPYAL